MQNQTSLAPWLQSSMDPTQVSNTIRGFGATLSGVIILIFAILGHSTSADQVQNVIDQTALLGGELAGGLGAAWTIYGLFMKFLMRLHGPITQ